MAIASLSTKRNAIIWAHAEDVSYQTEGFPNVGNLASIIFRKLLLFS